MGDVGEAVVEDIYNELNVDEKWSSPITRGFAWWGHRFRQRIWTTPGYNNQGIIIHRMFAVTDAVRDVEGTVDKVDVALGFINTMALGSAAVFSVKEKAVRFWCAVTVHEDIAQWMVRLFTSYAILQVIEVEKKAEVIAKLVNGSADVSHHPASGTRNQPDEMLTVLDTVFRPIGTRLSPWNGNPEMSQIRKILNGGNCFSMGDDAGLTAEFPFGEGTSMMRVITDEQHPVIGSGVGLFLHIPMWGTNEDAAQIAGALNRAEAAAQSIGHLLGSWCAKSMGEKSMPAFAFFMPTALHQPGLLTNLVFSMVGKAHWAGSLLNPGSTKADVLEIVAKRFKSLADESAR